MSFESEHTENKKLMAEVDMLSSGPIKSKILNEHMKISKEAIDDWANSINQQGYPGFSEKWLKKWNDMIKNNLKLET